MKYLTTDYLDRAARLYRDKTAVVDVDGRITYGELIGRAKEIATFLLGQGSCYESVIIYAPKSVITTCALWGIAYAGCYYTFLDTNQPEERSKKIAERLRTRVVLTDTGHYDKAKGLFVECEVYNIAQIHRGIDENLLRDVKEGMYCQNPLYVNFTSGTTGDPKGVMVGHLSVVDFIDIFVETFKISSEEVIGNQAPFDFDVSVKDIYSCAATGATLVIIPREYFTKPKVIMDYLCEEKVTTLIWAVSAMCFLSTMKAFMYKVPSAIRKVMFSGEIMPVKHLTIWRQFLPDAMYVNLYGPTEITCNCTYYILEHDRDYAGGIPIGKAFRNEKVYLLDENNELISEPERQGQICVAGITLALGYYGDAEETRARFIPNPMNTLYEEKMYLTGDLARYDTEGLLYYIGRSDAQIKHMGHRIELSEIEFYANQVEQVERTCCVFWEDRQRLILFYAGEAVEEAFYGYLGEKIPTHMIPAQCVQVEEVPLTKNGKMDRKKLLQDFMAKQGV